MTLEAINASNESSQHDDASRDEPANAGTPARRVTFNHMTIHRATKP